MSVINRVSTLILANLDKTIPVESRLGIKSVLDSLDQMLDDIEVDSQLEEDAVNDLMEKLNNTLIGKVDLLEGLPEAEQEIHNSDPVNLMEGLGDGDDTN